MKEMRRMRIVAAFAAVVMILAGCGKKTVDFDISALATDLDINITYQDTLEPMGVEMAGMFLNLSNVNVTNAAIFEGSGATAEEIIVLECADEEEAKKAEQVLKDRVSEQIESFTDYVPAELTKLNAAVIKVSGKYAVLSVSDDPEKAKKIIDKYL